MMSSEREIENLLYLYAEAIDAGDFERVADILAHAEMVGANDEGMMSGRDMILETYSTVTRRYEDDGTPHTKHVTSNAIIEVDEASDSATARSYFTVFQSLPDFPLQPIIAGRYHDGFERVDGRWRFCRRKIITELYGDLSRHLQVDLEGLNQGD